MARSGPSLGSCLANDTSQGLSARRQAPGYRCPGAPGCRSLGVASPTAPPTRTRPGRDTRRQSFPLASRGSGASGPVHQPLEPTSIATKKTLEGPPGGGRSKPTQPDMQSVRTEQLDDVQGFLGSKTPPRSTAHRCKTLLDSDARRP
jgi:hypothetical protein